MSLERLFRDEEELLRLFLEDAERQGEFEMEKERIEQLQEWALERCQSHGTAFSQQPAWLEIVMRAEQALQQEQMNRLLKRISNALEALAADKQP